MAIGEIDAISAGFGRRLRCAAAAAQSVTSATSGERKLLASRVLRLSGCVKTKLTAAPPRAKSRGRNGSDFHRKELLPRHTRIRDGPSGNGMEWPSAGPLSRRDRASSRHRRRGRSDPLCACQRPQSRRTFGWAQLGGQSPARRRIAARRQPPRPLRRRHSSDDSGRRAGQDRQRLRDRTRLTRALLPFGPLRGHSPRRLSVTGWIRLEQSGDRPGM